MYSYRSSELGGCSRMLVAKRLGMKELPTPEWQQAIYDKGNVHEPQCVEAMRADGWAVPSEPVGFTIHEGQAYIELAVTEDVKVTGHLDGICANDTNPIRVLEIKAPNAWAKFEKAYKTNDWSDPLTLKYAWQISVYMVATGLEAVVACWDEEHGVRTFGIEVPPFGVGQIQARVLALESYAEQGKLPDECDALSSFCAFKYLCSNAREEETDWELDALAGEYELGRTTESDGKRIKDNAKAALMEHLADRDNITTESWTVTRYEQKGSAYLDEKAMEADGIDLAKYRRQRAASERLKVTRRGATDE